MESSISRISFVLFLLATVSLTTFFLSGCKDKSPKTYAEGMKIECFNKKDQLILSATIKSAEPLKSSKGYRVIDMNGKEVFARGDCEIR